MNGKAIIAILLAIVLGTGCGGAAEGNQSAKTGACKPVDTLDRAQALGGREIRKRLAGKDEKLVGGAFSTGTQERVGEYWYLRARTTETAYMVTVNAATCKVKVRTCREAGGARGACYVAPTTDVASRAAKQQAFIEQQLPPVEPPPLSSITRKRP